MPCGKILLIRLIGRLLDRESQKGLSFIMEVQKLNCLDINEKPQLKNACPENNNHSPWWLQLAVHPLNFALPSICHDCIKKRRGREGEEEGEGEGEGEGVVDT